MSYSSLRRNKMGAARIHPLFILSSESTHTVSLDPMVAARKCSGKVWLSLVQMLKTLSLEGSG
jgi:hypothetical protein